MRHYQHLGATVVVPRWVEPNCCSEAQR